MSMKRIKPVLFFTIACALAAAAHGQTLKRIVTKSDSLDFGAGGTIVIGGAPNGSIKVTSSAGNQVEINAEITLEATNDADLALLEKVTGFVLQESVGKLVVTSVGTHDKKYLKQVAKKFPKPLIGLPFRIDYTIRVPRYCDLQIDAGKGDLSVNGIEGSIRINSLESTATLDLVGGGLNATFGKGSVNITMPDRSWRGGTIDVALTSGEMQVDLPATLSAELDATILRTGKIENSLMNLKPRVRTEKFTEKSIVARAGSGGVAMKFTVGDGTLKLKTIGKAD